MSIRIFSYSEWIDRPRVEVYDTMTDFAIASRWRTMVRSIEIMGGGEFQAGTRLRVTLDVRGETKVREITMTEVERPSLWRHELVDADFLSAFEYRLVEERGGTRVTLAGSVTPKTFTGWLVVPLQLMHRHRMYQEQLAALKQVVEARG